jgi:hypothetical protein
MKKAQVNLEFIISVAVFISTLTFITVNVMNIFPTFQSEINKDILKSKAWQISEILFKKGYPENWENLDEVAMLGFSTDKYYVLNKTKLTVINQCDSTSYDKIRELLNLDIREDFIINITLIEGATKREYVYCGPRVISLVAPKLWVTRFALINDEDKLKIIKIEVVVY